MNLDVFLGDINCC